MRMELVGNNDSINEVEMRFEYCGEQYGCAFLLSATPFTQNIGQLKIKFNNIDEVNEFFNRMDQCYWSIKEKLHI